MIYLVYLFERQGERERKERERETERQKVGETDILHTFSKCPQQLRLTNMKPGAKDFS